MKRSMLTIAAAIVIAGQFAQPRADMQLDASNSHLGFGVGMAVSQIPFTMSETQVPLSYFYWDRQFMDPNSFIRGSVEVGMYGFNMLIPVPEVGANLYVGSEENTIQGKLGVGGFYDVAVAGHGGAVVKGGVIFKNRFDINLFAVPVATDAKRSYNEALGFESKAAAEENRIANGGKYVITPYFGFLVTLRR